MTGTIARDRRIRKAITLNRSNSARNARDPSFLRTYIGITCDPQGPQRLTAFDLSDWRRGVASALENLGKSTGWSSGLSKAARFRVCGRAGFPVVTECIHISDHKLFAPYHCDIRTCPECARKRQGYVAARYAEIIGGEINALPFALRRGKGPKLLTLTRKNVGGFNPRELRKLVQEQRQMTRDFWYATWGDYRRRKLKASEAGTGAVFGIEISPATLSLPKSMSATAEAALDLALDGHEDARGPKSVQLEDVIDADHTATRWRWNLDPSKHGGMVHTHMVVYGEYRAHADLRDIWQKITGDGSFIVDIRALRSGFADPLADIRSGVRECLKYASKPMEASTPEHFGAIAAVEYAFDGCRRLGAFGVFYGKMAKYEAIAAEQTADEIKRCSCPTCGAPAHATGEIYGPGMMKREFAAGGIWIPKVEKPPPKEEEVVTWLPVM
jgi:hypothetical protein